MFLNLLRNEERCRLISWCARVGVVVTWEYAGMSDFELDDWVWCRMYECEVEDWDTKGSGG